MLLLTSTSALSFSLTMSCSVVSCFFFSSRRRHTRCLSDWSSDVCSSDLVPQVERIDRLHVVMAVEQEARAGAVAPVAALRHHDRMPLGRPYAGLEADAGEIGRASCRERV